MDVKVPVGKYKLLAWVKVHSTNGEDRRGDRWVLEGRRRKMALLLRSVKGLFAGKGRSKSGWHGLWRKWGSSDRDKTTWNVNSHKPTFNSWNWHSMHGGQFWVWYWSKDLQQSKQAACSPQNMNYMNLSGPFRKIPLNSILWLKISWQKGLQFLFLLNCIIS